MISRSFLFVLFIEPEYLKFIISPSIDHNLYARYSKMSRTQILGYLTVQRRGRTNKQVIIMQQNIYKDKNIFKNPQAQEV
jgi:hypothetical protein